MKNVKRYGAMALILMAIISSCKKDNTSDLKQKVDDFSAIDYRLPGKLKVQNGDHFEVQIKEKGKSPNKAKTKVIDGELIIYADNNVSGNDLDITVIAPTFKKLKNEGQGEAVIEYNFDPATNLELEASGSGNITAITSLEVAKISAKVYGGGDINISGGAIVKTDLDALINGAGAIHAFSLKAANTKAVILGSGNLECNVSSKLDVKINGTGSVIFKGDAIATYDPNSTGTGKMMHVD